MGYLRPLPKLGAIAMSTTSLDYLFEVSSPYIVIGQGEPERKNWNPGHFFARSGVDTCVRSLRGTKMVTTARLMDEIAAALQFFDGFGENWYALEDCLCTMDEWLPATAYVLVVENAERVLVEEDQASLSTFMRVVHAAGLSWSRPIVGSGRFDRPATPFHLLLYQSTLDSSSDARLTAAATDAAVPYRGDD